METKLTPSRRPDAIDAERFREMLGSPLFLLLWDRVAAEQERTQSLCERAEGAVELRRAQGAAQALRAVRAMPQQILGELAKKKS